jgi:hypothetical protein
MNTPSKHLTGTISTLTWRAPALALAVAAGVASFGAPAVVDAAPTLSPAKPGLPPVPGVKVGAPVDVQLRLSQMQCVNLTREEGLNNDRDEVYVLVRGNTKAGLVGERFPLHYNGNAGDSYYEFWMNKANTQDGDWTNHDQVAVGRPLLWSGQVDPGQTVEFLVSFMEQDNGDLASIKKALQEGLKLAGELYSQPQYDAIIDAAKGLADKVPEIKGHELIGSFMVQITNKGGKIETTWLPVVGKLNDAANPAVQGVSAREKAQAAMFDMAVPGGSGQYVVIPTVAEGPVVPRRYYINRNTDRCGESLLAVEGSNGFYHADKGKTAWVPLKEPRFRWYCGTSEEWATLPPGTNLVQTIRSGSDDRKITWVAYQEKGERPDYKPTQTYVKLSDEKDKCGGTDLFVEGRGGFYKIGKGQSKFAPVGNRKFTWYCDTTQESATCPEGTNLVIARRTGERDITWSCAREKVSLDPWTKPDDTKVMIGRTTDQCSEENLNVWGTGGFYRIAKGEQRTAPVDANRFNWSCATAVEATTCPNGTNLVTGARSATNRQIDWSCWREVADLAKYKQPSGHDVLLGKTEDKCGESILKVENKQGDRVTVKKGQTAEVMLKDNRFRWWCGGTEELTTLPAHSNKVKVVRAKEDRDITWHAYVNR